MKHAKIFLLAMAATCCLWVGCKKNSVEEDFSETVPPVIPDFSTQVIASVQGFIYNESGIAMQGATVKAGIFTVQTDAMGYFRINNVSFPKSVALLQVSKPGYFTGYKSFLPVEGKKHFCSLQLVPLANHGSFPSGTGGSINIPGGATVQIPGNAMVIKSSGASYSGSVQVAAHWFNPATMEQTQATMPGDLRGIDTAGHITLLTTYGMLGVLLTGDAGEELQLAPGNNAVIQMPIPTSLAANAPNKAPLWHFDEQKGIWMEESVAVKSGNMYTGTVSHFSFWNVDIPNSTVSFSAQILDDNLNPLPNIAVSIAINGVPNSVRTDYTDDNGVIIGQIPANSSLRMYIQLPCGNSYTLQQINTSNLPVTLGSIKVNLEMNAGVFEGTVKNCSGLAVTDGYVIITGGVSSNVIEIDNGQFSLAGFVCPASTASYIAFDRTTGQQSAIGNISVISGTNTIGTITACSAPLSENITYNLDAFNSNLVLPQHLFDGNYNFASNTTTIKATDLLNGNAVVFNLSFNGGGSAGTYPVSGDLLTLNAPYQFINPASVTITNYGLIGEYISGNLSGNIKNLNTNTNHTFSCNFNIKRDM